MNANLSPTAGCTIGLLGGSFDPPHAGHAHITREAIKRFGLGQVWWLVSPGNPLKAHGPAPMPDRMAAAQRLMRDDTRVTITDIEARLGTRYTAQTLRRMRVMYPRARFVWLMGADNLAQFHQWRDWHDIMNMVPIGVMARPGDRMSARVSRAAQYYRASRLPASASHLLGQSTAPAWCFVNIPMLPISSSSLRALAGRKPPAPDVLTGRRPR